MNYFYKINKNVHQKLYCPICEGKIFDDYIIFPPIKILCCSKCGYIIQFDKYLFEQSFIRKD